jgi:hypothetical protein
MTALALLMTTLTGQFSYAAEHALPRMLTPAFFKKSDVCADARERAGDKRYALVVVKNHICDFGAAACLNVTRTVSDPCNRFVAKNFVTYHTRYYRCVPGDRTRGCTDTPGNESISDVWGNAGPDLVVMDLRSCEVIGRTGAGVDRFNDPDPIERFRGMRAQLLRQVHGLADGLGIARPWDEPEGSLLTCALPADRANSVAVTIDSVWREIERQGDVLGQNQEP